MLIRKDDLDKNVKDAIIDIAKKYGTPFYIYSFDKIESKIALLKDALCGCGNLYYSAKANPNIDILKIMQQSGLGVEVSSICELELAKAAGFLPDKIVFSGPGKDDATIERLVDERIRCINVESFNEIRTIQEKSCLAGVVTNISIRLNPVNKMSNAGMKMTGVSSKFGVDLNDIQFVIGKAKEFDNVYVAGIQVYFGTQILDADKVIFNVNYTMDLVEKIEEKFDLNFEHIDFGGGFGIPYFEGQSDLDIVSMKNAMHRIANEKKSIFSNKYCIFESGRFLVGDSGFYVTSVLETKKSQDKFYIICDGGSNHHAESAFLGRIVSGNFPISIIGEGDTIDFGALNNVNVCGPLCTPTDIIARNIKLERCIEPGALVVIKQSGAYGLTNSPILFNSHKLPKEFILYDNGCKLSHGLHELLKILLGNA